MSDSMVLQQLVPVLMSIAHVAVGAHENVCWIKRVLLSWTHPSLTWSDRLPSYLNLPDPGKMDPDNPGVEYLILPLIGELVPHTWGSLSCQSPLAWENWFYSSSERTGPSRLYWSIQLPPKHTTRTWSRQSPTSNLSRTCWSMWRDWCCGATASEPPWLGSMEEYQRVVSVGSWYGWYTKTRSLEHDQELYAMNICK